MTEPAPLAPAAFLPAAHVELLPLGTPPALGGPSELLTVTEVFLPASGFHAFEGDQAAAAAGAGYQVMVFAPAVSLTISFAGSTGAGASGAPGVSVARALGHDSVAAVPALPGLPSLAPVARTESPAALSAQPVAAPVVIATTAAPAAPLGAPTPAVAAAAPTAIGVAPAGGASVVPYHSAGDTSAPGAGSMPRVNLAGSAAPVAPGGNRAASAAGAAPAAHSGAPGQVASEVEFPQPQEADLLTRFMPFDRASLDSAIDRFLSRFDDLNLTLPDLRPPLALVPTSLAVAVALLASDALLRRRHRADDEDFQAQADPALLRLAGLPDLRSRKGK